MADWDESDAFLMPPRQSLSSINQALKPAWDFGPWAESYYGRLTIFPLTSDGFAQGSVQEVGFTQGDDFSGEGYQPGCVVVSVTMEESEHVCL